MSGAIPPHKKVNVIRERACRVVLCCASPEIYLNFLLVVNNPVSYIGAFRISMASLSHGRCNKSRKL
jgi:hypothetical protein